MKEIVTDKFIMKVANFQGNVNILCSHCSCAKNGLPNKNECPYTDIWKLENNGKIKIAITKLVIKNVSSELLEIRRNRFDVVDSLGFIYKPFFVCEKHTDSRAIEGSYNLPSNTQIYFNLYTASFETNTTLSKVCFTDRNNHVYAIEMSDSNDEIVSFEEKLQIDNYKLSEELNRLQKEGKNIVNKFYRAPTEKISEFENENVSPKAKSQTENCNSSEEIKEINISNEKINIENQNKESKIHYRTEEDDECFYIISEEKEKFITFSRRFDLNKSNYNWVNKGEPLVLLFFDEDNSIKIAVCELNSPATGVFEFDKKRFIAYNEVICKIRKHSVEKKAEVFRELEKQAMKELLLKREQKKKLEREALDELIAEGLVFNIYVDRMGNRNKIPNDLANAIWNRDGGKCCFCGSRENLEFDHIIPVTKGGATTFQNLQLLCKTCNIKKFNKIG